jgi:hypothetical protein
MSKEFSTNYRLNLIKNGKKPLSEAFPEIAKEWDSSKNLDEEPEFYTSGSNQRVWWLCNKGHSYQATIYDRTKQLKRRGCPYCSGKKLSSKNSAVELYSELFKEWHPTKNQFNKTDVSFGSRKKAWWKCKNGHEYEARINHRVSGSGCPYCSRSTSIPEIRILTELTSIFPVNSRFKIEKSEIDIYIPKYKVGIEFDGSFWHKDKYEKDLEKNKKLEGKLNLFLRIRVMPLEKISDHDIRVSNDEVTKELVNKICLSFINLLTPNDKKKVNSYIVQNSFLNEDLFRKYLSYFPSPFPENSLQEKFPDIAKEWNYTKNFPLTPTNYSFGAAKKVWWKCGVGHEWESSINRRTNGNLGCPICKSGLVNYYPEIAKEWNYHKNGDLNLQNMKFGSDLKVWWLCKNGHEFEQKINARTLRNRGCPYCSGRFLCSTSSLANIKPELANEWHPFKNETLTPNDVTYKTIQKVWWQCKSGHEWEARISNRNNGQNCPICSRKKSK